MEVILCQHAAAALRPGELRQAEPRKEREREIPASLEHIHESLPFFFLCERLYEVKQKGGGRGWGWGVHGTVIAAAISVRASLGSERESESENVNTYAHAFSSTQLCANQPLKTVIG